MRSTSDNCSPQVREIAGPCPEQQQSGFSQDPEGRTGKPKEDILWKPYIYKGKDSASCGG